MRPDTEADLAAPDIVLKTAEELLPLIDGLVVIQTTDQGDIICKRVAPGNAGIVLVSGILETTGVKAEAKVVVGCVITADYPRRADFACVEGCKIIPHAAGAGLAHRVQASAL